MYLFRANLENCRFLGLAYPPNIFLQLNVHECKHSSRLTVKICLALNGYKNIMKGYIGKVEKSIEKESFFAKNKYKIMITCFVLFLVAAMACFVFLVDFGKGKKVRSVDDLEGSRIGVQIGTTGDIYASDYEGDKAGTTISRYNKGADAVQALKQNKIDAVIIDEQPAIKFVEKNPELSILDEEFTVEDYAICVSKDNPELTKSINKTLEELRADGTIDEIISYYIGDGSEGKRYESPQDIVKNGTINMATNAEFPPYEYYADADDSKVIGIDVDIMTAIADKLGKELKVVDMQFDSIILSVQSGKADVGAAGMTVTEDRLKNIDFTDSYTQSKQVIIVKTSEAQSKLSLKERFKQSFIKENRYKYIVRGLGNTLLITIFAGIFGIMLGFILAIIRVAHDSNDDRGPGISILNVIARAYITLFRGTPMVVQLLIMYYVIFSGIAVNPLVAAILAFSLNSGAYVAEAVRAGIISIPTGQFEAGRSLGFTYGKTMIYIIMPQAIKNALPAMCNEFIALLKESSIVGYIGLMDVTRAGDIIRSNTYEAMLPLLAVAAIYLVIVMILTYFVGRLERRLKKDAR